MPGLPPVLQEFGIQASAYLAGIDEMLAATDRLAASIDAVAASAERMSASLSAASARADESLTAAAGAADESAAAADRATTAQVSLSDAEKASADAAASCAGLIADLERSQTLLADSAKAVTDGLAAEAKAMGILADEAALAGDATAVAGDKSVVAGDKAEAAGGKAATAGAAWKTALLGIGVAAVYGVDKAAKFQEQVTRLYTAAGLTGASMAQVSQKILNVGDATGFTGTQIAEALYHPVSAGLALNTALAAVTQGAQLAQIHGASLDDTMYALSSVMKAFNQNAGDAGNTAALLNSIVGQGDMRFQDFNQSVKNWAPTGASMGISIQSMGAAIAYLTDRGNSAEVASTRLTMGLSMVTAGSKEANTFLKALGLTSGSVALQNKSLADVMNSYGLTTNKIAADLKQPDGIYGALNDLQGAFKHAGLSGEQADQVMAKLFGGGRSDKAILSLMSNLDGLRQKYVSIGKGVSDYGNSWAKTQETVSFQWKKAVGDVQNLAISFGSVLLPAALKVLSALGRFASLLEQHPALAAFAGALLAVAVAFKVVAAAEAIFDAVTAADPIMLAVMAVIALVYGLYELYEHCRIVRVALADVGHVLAVMWDGAVRGAKDAVHWIASAWDSVVSGAKSVPGRVASAWDSLTGGAAKAGHSVAGAFSSGWDDVYRDTVGEVVRAFEAVKGAITSGFDGWWKTHGQAVKEVWRATWNEVKATFTAVWSEVMAVLVPAVHAVEDILKAAWVVVTTVTSVAWETVSSYLKLVWAEIKTAAKIAWDGIVAAVKIAWDVIAATFKVAAALITAVVKTAWDVIAAVFKVAFAAVEAVVKITWDVIVGIFNVALDLITGHWSQAWSDVKATAVQVWNAIGGFLSATWNAIAGVAIQVWNNIKGFLIQTWNAIASLVVQVFDHVRDFLVQAWNAIYQGVVSAWHTIYSFFSSAPGRILGALGNVGSLLFSAGEQIVQGLINGVESMASAAWNAITSLGSSLIHGAMSVLHINSPSLEFYKIGASVTEGLALGVNETAAQAVQAANSLAAKVNAAYKKGQITAAEQTQLLGRIDQHLAARSDTLGKTMRKLGLEMGRQLLTSIADATSASTAKTAVDKLNTYILQAWSVGDVSFNRASQLLTWVYEDNTKLQTLAAQRQSIVSTMKAADAYAAKVTSSTESWASLSNAETVAGGSSGADIGQGMTMQLDQIKKFAHDIQVLGKRGLSKTLLDQIIQAGPASGLPIAESLMDDTAGQISSLNAAQNSINYYSQGLGATAANAMYDAGSQTGKGFLSGLVGQEHAITAEMSKIANSMVATLKRDLKISSPSRVMHDAGSDTAAGLVQGLVGGRGGVQQAAHGLAQAITAGVNGGAGLGGLRVTGTGFGASGGTTVIQPQITVHGYIGNEQELAQELYELIQHASLQSNRRNPTNGLSLTV